MKYQFIALFVVLLIVCVVIKTSYTEGLNPALLTHQYEDLYTGEVHFYGRDKKWKHTSPIYKPDHWCKKIKHYQEDVDMGPGMDGSYGDLIWTKTSPKNIYGISQGCNEEIGGYEAGAIYTHV